MHKVSRTRRRRRLEGKTDYKARLGMLKSGKPRVVFRKTNRYIIGQIVSSEIANDKVILGVTSKDLISHGWPEGLKGSLKNLAACYLTGYLLGSKSKEVREGIFDIGLNKSIGKSRVYAFLKGVVDSEFSIAYNDKILPGEDLITRNEKTKNIVDEIKDKIGGSKWLKKKQ
tara:strand:+ start:3674 stop:4186 length:513 start_codon:yes stop_codon:yes gene_type:complete